MDDRQQINSGSKSANMADISEKIKTDFFEYFEPVVDDCCMRIDLELGVQLGKNREKFSKEQYIKLLEYLRSIRKELKQNYLLKIHEIFHDMYQKAASNQPGGIDFSKVSLSSDAAVKESHAIAQIISECEHLFYEELASFNKHIALSQGKHTIADSQNPIFPDKLMRALVEAVQPLKLNTDCRIALYKTFEANVFSQLGFIYRELIKRCEMPVTPPLYLVGEIKEAVEPALTAVEHCSAEFRLLQEKLLLWRGLHTPSAYDLTSATPAACYEHFEILNALQILQQFNEDLEAGEKIPVLKWRVLKKLEELSFSDKAKNLAQQDEDVLDLVAIIFSEIERDELLQDAVKKVILQLEIPVAVISVGRYSIFTLADNPVRQLLDDLFAAGLFLNVDEHDDLLILQRIASAVKKMSKDSGGEFPGWTKEADEFSSYLTKQIERSQVIEQNIRQSMNKQQEVESVRKLVFTVIENSMKGKALPTAIVEFLRNVWSEVLLDVYMRNNEQPERWVNTVQAMDDLIISVMPPADEVHKKQILKFLPGLITELRQGLKQISYDKAAQSRFFKDLAVWHIILMDKKEVKQAMVEGNALPDKMDTVAGNNSELTKNLALGSWVEFTSESVRDWGKLLWKDAAMENMLFVRKSGEKMFEIHVNELAKKLKLGQVVLVKVNQQTITERVLSELMGL